MHVLARTKPSAVSESARGACYPENFESVDAISCILRHLKHAFGPFI